MIFTDRTIIVQKGISSINDTIILYRGDKGVEIRFTLNEGSPFRFGSGASPNIIEKTEAAYGQLIIKRPNDLPAVFSEIAPTNGGKIVFTITAEMIDEITEVGNYTFQIRLFDESRNSRATIPEVVNGIEIREPIATEDITTTNEVGVAAVGYAITTAGTTEDAFDSQGNYNKTTWGTGDRITASKLNKMEAGIDGVNKKVASGGTGGQGMTEEQAQQLNTAYQHSQSTHAPSNAEANVQVDWNVTDTTSDAYIKNKPTNLATIDQIPTVPTKTSQLTNDSGYLTEHQDLSGYAKTTDIPTVPTNVSAFTNDADYASQTYVRNKIAEAALGGDTGSIPLPDNSITSTMIGDKVIEGRHLNPNLFLTNPGSSGGDTPSTGTGISMTFSNIINNEGRKANLYLSIVINNPFKTSTGSYTVDCDITSSTTIPNKTVQVRSFFNPTSDPTSYDNITGILHTNTDKTMNGTTFAYSSGDISIDGTKDYDYLKVVLAFIDCYNIVTSSDTITLDNIDIKINGISISRSDIIDANVMLGSATVEITGGASSAAVAALSDKEAEIKLLRNVDLQDHIATYHTGSASSGNATSKWAGKKILAIGDSITDAKTPETKYISFIKDNIGCTVTNNGISGSGFMSGTSLVNGMGGLGTDYDLVYVFLGTNDYGNNGGQALGSWGDSGTSTFYGAVDYCFGQLVEKYSTKTIAVFTPLPRQNGWTNNSAGYNMNDYCEAIRKTAEKYSLPLLDLHKYSGFLANSATFRANYCYGGNGTSGGDGLHPNTAWHRDFLAHKVLSFLETL